jgi:hypothetical protein
MADPAKPAAPSRCAACGFENPTATLYCQNCGGKLGIAPPSYLTSTAAPPEAADAAVAPAKKPRILSAKRASGGPALLGFLLRRLPFLAIVTAAVLIFLPPANIPPVATTLEADTIGAIRTGLASVAQHHSRVSAPWSRLNAYLATVLASGNASGIASFTRAFLQPRPGGFDLVVQKSIAGVPLYSSVTYQLVVRAGHLELQPAGAALGRLPLPKLLAPAIAALGGDLSAPLALEFNLLRQARTVRLSPEGVLVDFGPARP